MPYVGANTSAAPQLAQIATTGAITGGTLAATGAESWLMASGAVGLLVAGIIVLRVGARMRGSQC